MSFYTVLHFVRPTAPPLVTGRDLAGFVREVAALRLTEPGNGFDFSVRFGRRIDLDRKPIVQTRRLSACVSTHRFIDWDMEEHHADLAGVCDALAGQSRTIYRAHVGFGFLRDEIYAALSRAGSPENTIDLRIDSLGITIEPIRLECLGSAHDQFAGWMSLDVSGPGCIWPWTLPDLIRRAEGVAGLRRAMDVCRRTFPVVPRRPSWWVRRARRRALAFWPCDDVNAPLDWSWGVTEG